MERILCKELLLQKFGKFFKLGFVAYHKFKDMVSTTSNELYNSVMRMNILLPSDLPTRKEF